MCGALSRTLPGMYSKQRLCLQHAMCQTLCPGPLASIVRCISSQTMMAVYHWQTILLIACTVPISARHHASLKELCSSSLATQRPFPHQAGLRTQYRYFVE